MTPIERIPDDYEPAEFEQFPDGNVAISGIRWFTLDDDQMPMFVVQTCRCSWSRRVGERRG
jgi:hypothetical protein